MKTLVHKAAKKVAHPMHGLYVAFRDDVSFRMEVGVGVLYLILGYVLWPLSPFELVALTLSWTLLLITELQNTALEMALDGLHPERHERIGQSKDVAAAAVVVAHTFAALAVGAIIISRII